MPAARRKLGPGCQAELQRLGETGFVFEGRLVSFDGISGTESGRLWKTCLEAIDDDICSEVAVGNQKVQSPSGRVLNGFPGRSKEVEIGHFPRVLTLRTSSPRRSAPFPVQVTWVT